MSTQAEEHLIELLAAHAQPLPAETDRYDSLLADIGDARFVLMGEASHGTEEFYQARMDISKRLIQEKGFMAIAIEGDWPDAYSVHRYLQGVGEKNASDQALQSFVRFPEWMWRNQTVSPFLRWLRDYNDQIKPRDKIGFFGLDLYSLYGSMQAVIDYLQKIDPEAARRAKDRYACFDHIQLDPQHYGLLCSEGIRKSCSNEVMQQMQDLYFNSMKYLSKDGLTAEDEFFQAYQNARLVKDAEHYYRSMFEGHISSWNNRDTHMVETLESIADHLENHLGRPAKLIVWAHNSHVGDARATEMGQNGEINVGQLVREMHPEDTYSIGFSTYEGTVTAADDWDTPGKIVPINAGLDGSYEALFHALPYDQFMLMLRGNKALEHYLKLPRLQRAIGVVYRPNTERASHYFFTQLPYQFDCMIHLDKTNAVKPLK